MRRTCFRSGEDSWRDLRHRRQRLRASAIRARHATLRYRTSIATAGSPARTAVLIKTWRPAFSLRAVFVTAVIPVDFHVSPSRRRHKIRLRVADPACAVMRGVGAGLAVVVRCQGFLDDWRGEHSAGYSRSPPIRVFDDCSAGHFSPQPFNKAIRNTHRLLRDAGEDGMRIHRLPVTAAVVRGISCIDRRSDEFQITFCSHFVPFSAARLACQCSHALRVCASR